MYIEIVIDCNEGFAWEKKSKFKEGPDAGQDVGGLESKRRSDLSEENRIACSLQNIGSGYKQDYTYAGTKVTTAAACRTMICPLLKQVEAAQPTKQKTV